VVPPPGRAHRLGVRAGVIDDLVTENALGRLRAARE
jgi:hypothetical protein